MKALDYGLFAKEVKSTHCRESLTGPKRYFNNKINNVEITDSVWTIDVSVIGNCCHEFLCDISIENDSILNLIYIGYGGPCKCDCWYGLIYKIEVRHLFGTPGDIKYVMINADNKTLINREEINRRIRYKR